MVDKPWEETPGHLLAGTCKRLRGRVHGCLETLGLYRGQQFALRALWAQDGLTHSELADRLNVRPATVTNMVKRMEKAGFVERRRDAEDERVSRAYLTQAGRDIQTVVEEAWQGLEKRAFAGFSPDELDLLGQFLRRIQENLDLMQNIAHDRS